MDFFLICENNVDKLLKDPSNRQERTDALVYLQPIIADIRTFSNGKSKRARDTKKQRESTESNNVSESGRKRRKIEGAELIGRNNFNMGLFRKAFPSTR